MEGNSRGKCSAYSQKIKSDSVIFGIGDKVSPNNYVAILTNKSLCLHFLSLEYRSRLICDKSSSYVDNATV